MGWHTDAEYANFCDVYGFDVTRWDAVIRAINELKMTTWLMQNVRESDRVASEFRTRLRPRSYADVVRFFQDVDIVPPGVVTGPTWRAGWFAPDPRRTLFYAGLAQKMRGREEPG